MNPFARIVIIIAGIVAIVTGIIQMTGGFKEMNADPEVDRLAKESDTAFAAANADLSVAASQFQSVLKAVEKDGLATVRRDRRADLENVIVLYGKATDNLRLAAQKADEATARKPGEKVEEFLKSNAEALRGFAAARDISRDIARMVLDESIKNTEEFDVKFNAATERSQKLENAANEQIAHANKLRSAGKK